MPPGSRATPATRGATASRGCAPLQYLCLDSSRRGSASRCCSRARIVLPRPLGPERTNRPCQTDFQSIRSAGGQSRKTGMQKGLKPAVEIRPRFAIGAEAEVFRVFALDLL